MLKTTFFHVISSVVNLLVAKPVDCSKEVGRRRIVHFLTTQCISEHLPRQDIAEKRVSIPHVFFSHAEPQFRTWAQHCPLSKSIIRAQKKLTLALGGKQAPAPIWGDVSDIRCWVRPCRWAGMMAALRDLQGDIRRGNLRSRSHCGSIC